MIDHAFGLDLISNARASAPKSLIRNADRRRLQVALQRDPKGSGATSQFCDARFVAVRTGFDHEAGARP